ncbi:MAG: SOS response-associated peptidase [Proteobacteria bacterium]|nr:MAG: SOS response-associated peptidase [Pseudomonadota bacterium]
MNGSIGESALVSLPISWMSRQSRRAAVFGFNQRSPATSPVPDPEIINRQWPRIGPRAANRSHAADLVRLLDDSRRQVITSGRVGRQAKPMCGRFDRHSELTAFAELVDGLTLEGAPNVPPSYNVTPSQDAVAVVAEAEGACRLRAFSWGLVPAWSNKPELRRPINARAETVAEKPMFRGAFARQRCLVLCDGYYEWQVTSSGKQPVYFRGRGGSALLIAGLWERNTRLAAYPLNTFCVLTREASEAVRGVHHRMPVLLEGEALRSWLAADASTDDLRTLALEQSIEDPDFYPVSTFVNSPANDSERCIERVSPGS